MKGVERRIEAGLDPKVESVASLFMSRWDVAVAKDGIADELKNRLGIAIGKRAYRNYVESVDSERVKNIEDEGGHHQRLLWASTGTKDPDASDTLYIEAFASPDTVNTMPEKTLLAFADHGEVGDPLPRGRWRRRGGPEGVRGRGSGHRRARAPAPGRGRRRLRQVLARRDRLDLGRGGEARQLACRDRADGTAPEAGGDRYGDQGNSRGPDDQAN